MPQGNPVDISIRVATVDDVDGVLAVWRQARSAAATTADTPASVRRLIGHTGDALLVAEDRGRIVAALVAAWDGWRGNMYRLAVLPEYRRLGIARRLVDAGHDRLRAKGAPRVIATVAVDEPPATELWSAAGYAKDGDLIRFVRNL